MPTLIIPQNWSSRAHSLSVRCTSKRRFAVVQLITNHTTTHKGNYRPKVLKRTDSAKVAAAHVRNLGGYSYVFDNYTGKLIWHNTASEWLAAENAILNHSQGGSK